MRWEHRNYEEKKQTLDAKMEIAQVVLTERLAVTKTKDQARLFRIEHASICDEIERQKWICQNILAKPNFKSADYPVPFEIRMPPNRTLTDEEFDYYYEMEKKLRRWDSRASEAYLDRLKDVKTPEEKEQIYKDQERYVVWSNVLQAKIRYAYEKKDSPKESPKKSSDKEQSPEEKLGNEYLDLEQPKNVPAVRQISQHELDLMFQTGITPTPNMPSPQKTMDEKIPEILKESRLTTPINDESKKKKEELLQKKNLYHRERRSKRLMYLQWGKYYPN